MRIRRAREAVTGQRARASVRVRASVVARREELADVAERLVHLRNVAPASSRKLAPRSARSNSSAATTFAKLRLRALAAATE